MPLKRDLKTDPFKRGELCDISLADIRLEDLEVMVKRGQFLTIAELAKYLNIVKSNLMKAKREGLPFVYGKIRCETAVAWLEKQQRNGRGSPTSSALSGTSSKLKRL